MKILPAILIGLITHLAIGISMAGGQVMHALETTATPTPTPPEGVVETYKVVNGMNIRATVYNVDDGQRHRVAIVIHGGGYFSGGMQTNVAQELSQYGLMGVAIEYRLAPPHVDMNSPTHPFPGQNDIHDDGHYPEQTEDVRDAIVHYRSDSRSNGEVVVIGGSAGGSHSLYMSGTGTPGYDMPDLAVLLSCGVSNLADPDLYGLDCINFETCPHGAVTNYLDIPDPAPLSPIGTDLVLAQEASPSHWMHFSMCPFWSMCSTEDSLGIPTSTGYNIYSYYPYGAENVLENGANGIVPTALAIGLKESIATVPEAGSFKTTVVDVSVHSHSFDYWDEVKNQVIPWINAAIPPLPTSTPGASTGNISTRGFVQTGSNVMIGGFVVQGTGTKRVIIRAIGPELTLYGIINALANPTLELYDSVGALIGFNDNWQTTVIGGFISIDQVTDILNSGFAPTDLREPAIIADLPPGNYTAIVRGIDNATGVALVEAYDLSPGTTSVLSNVSTRGFVQTSDDVMIGGFMVHGTGTKKVIIRAIGPELGAPPYNLSGALADPTLELHDATGALIGSNDNWQTTIIGGIITSNQVSDIQNSGFAPTNQSESAIIADLAPGNYTAIVSGVNNTTGLALVEVDDLN
jgi:acetyl esterase/lipase